MMMFRNTDDAPFRQLKEGSEVWKAIRFICSLRLIEVVGDGCIGCVESVNGEKLKRAGDIHLMAREYCY